MIWKLQEILCEPVRDIRDIRLSKSSSLYDAFAYNKKLKVLTKHQIGR